MRLFGIGGYTYINIDYIIEVCTMEEWVKLVDGTKVHFESNLFRELLDVIKPTMFGSQCEFK